MMDWSDNSVWLAFGLLGNVAFGSRFLLQWVASERRGESFVPVAFWYLSIVGSLILLIYAIHLENVVFTLAYLPNAFVYYRNLALIRKKSRSEDP
ncbi:MAG: lipid-A-disaccharide synthase N-terminal domain-containing protein [Proteobacteria bacterium]|nr:lipid-A-disaccharide synthase N-terminal domain-containing protein [Pseudomonadota bacterium]MCZ6783959.1 lipid-A-disaccharide synthase N-terminal domain-containing protein [Pseudomonadota bacterium]